MAHKYQAEIRPNERGGYEIGDPGTPAGTGLGNYATPQDAYAVACYSFERAQVRAWRAPATAKPDRSTRATLLTLTPTTP